VVPTWNYAVVQARGTLVALDEAATKHAIVSHLTRHHEARQPHPWAVDDAPDDYVAQMLRAIVGIEIPLTSLVGKFKLSQNRSAEDRDGATAALRAQADDPGAQALAAHMAHAAGQP
jgi:transcriptional regulator